MPPEPIDVDADVLAWDKQDGLLPAIVQDADNRRVLMLGYMNRDALQATLASGQVTFFSRSRGGLWRKGETSGHVLQWVAIDVDCDRDTLLIQARPAGPTCHLGRTSCFAAAPGDFVATLDRIVAKRVATRPADSYTSRLLDAGVRRIAQKVGEEGVETALAAVAQDDATLLGEAADLVYHLQVLLHARGLDWAALAATLQQRHAGSPD